MSCNSQGIHVQDIWSKGRISLEVFGICVCESVRVRGTYSSQNEMICDGLAWMFHLDLRGIATHIVREPIVLQSLHVLSCH